jgi:predicted TIM-barrel fold metal-dependent hydrolase
MDEWRGVKGRFFWTGNQVRNLGDIEKDAATRGGIEAGYLPEKRIAFQDEAGVAAEVMYTSAMLAQMRSKDPEVLQAAARVYNDWIYGFCTYDLKRLVPVAMIPTHDVAWAVAELDRNLARGFRGAMVNLGAPAGRPPYRDPSYDPLWARASEAGVPITLHSGTGSYPDPFHFGTAREREESPGVLLNGYGEVQVVLANDFIFGRLLDRFPKLVVVCSEFELSWIPYFLWRIDQMQSSMANRLKLGALDERASDYMKSRVYHGTIDDDHAAYTIGLIGAGQVIWGSDYPHVRSIGLNAPAILDRYFAALSAADRTKVVAGNARALYRLAV